jgi:hypothetical protein
MRGALAMASPAPSLGQHGKTGALPGAKSLWKIMSRELKRLTKMLNDEPVIGFSQSGRPFVQIAVHTIRQEMEDERKPLARG